MFLSFTAAVNVVVYEMVTCDLGRTCSWKQGDYNFDYLPSAFGSVEREEKVQFLSR